MIYSSVANSVSKSDESTEPVDARRWYAAVISKGLGNYWLGGMIGRPVSKWCETTKWKDRWETKSFAMITQDDLDDCVRETWRTILTEQINGNWRLYQILKTILNQHRDFTICKNPINFFFCKRAQHKPDPRWSWSSLSHSPFTSIQIFLGF